MIIWRLEDFVAANHLEIHHLLLIFMIVYLVQFKQNTTAQCFVLHNLKSKNKSESVKNVLNEHINLEIIKAYLSFTAFSNVYYVKKIKAA